MFSGHLWLTSYTAKLRKRSGSWHQSGRRRKISNLRPTQRLLSFAAELTPILLAANRPDLPVLSLFV